MHHFTHLERSPRVTFSLEKPRGGQNALRWSPGPSLREVESDGGGAPASALRCRCATCGPRTSLTSVLLLFHRCRTGVLVAGCCEVPQDEPQSRSEVKRSAWAFMLMVSAALAAGACPPDRPSRWISLTALVSLRRTGNKKKRVGSARRAPVDQSGITPDHPLDGPRRRTPPSSCISRFDFRELKLLLFHGACRRARARVGGAGA